MNLKHITLSSLFAAAPLMMVIFALPAGCILNDDFIKEQNAFACTSTAECSEPGFECLSGFCAIDDGRGLPCTTNDQDKDGDGFGTSDDRQNCEFPQLDLDDDCAACTPVAKETCDGFDNDSNEMIDEPISCAGSITDCPLSAVIPAGSQWSCKENLCILVPQMRATAECMNVTLACVGGAFDNTEAVANGCIIP